MRNKKRLICGLGVFGVGMTTFNDCDDMHEMPFSSLRNGSSILWRSLWNDRRVVLHKAAALYYDDRR